MKPEINNNLISKDKLKDVLITKTAIKTLVPVSIVEKIVNHSFKEAAQALKTNRDVEITGFGIFKTNDYRAKQLIQKKKNQIQRIEEILKTRELSQSARENYEKGIEKLKLDIEYINKKLNTENNQEL